MSIGLLGIVLAGAEVVFFNLAIIVLAGEHKGVVERSAGFYSLAERLVCIIIDYITKASALIR